LEDFVEINEVKKSKNWTILVLIPVCVIGTIMVTRWIIKSGSGTSQAPGVTEEYTGGTAEERAAAAIRQEEAARPASDPSQYNPAGGAIRQPESQRPAAASRPKTAPAEDPDAAKKNWSLGAIDGALPKLLAKIVNKNPKAVVAIFNNEYVVKGFFSRKEVKAVMRSKSSLVNFLKNPDNFDEFINMPCVQEGMKNPELLRGLASSKMAGAILDQPAAAALNNDPQAVGDIIAAVPAIIPYMTDPNIMAALSANPRVSGSVSAQTR
jgi:hypothetical protein